MKTATAFLLLTSAAVAALFSNGLTGGEKTTNRQVEEMLDERAIILTVNSIATNAERRDWQAVQAVFADEVLLDYSSMGAKVETLKPAVIIERWKAILPGVEVTQHTVTNHEVKMNGAEAACFSYVDSLHFLPNDSGKNTWRVMGTYEHHLVKTAKGWHVDRMKLNKTLIEGNNDLPKLAMKVLSSHKK